MLISLTNMLLYQSYLTFNAPTVIGVGNSDSHQERHLTWKESTPNPSMSKWLTQLNWKRPWKWLCALRLCNSSKCRL